MFITIDGKCEKEIVINIDKIAIINKSDLTIFIDGRYIEVKKFDMDRILGVMLPDY